MAVRRFFLLLAALAITFLLHIVDCNQNKYIPTQCNVFQIIRVFGQNSSDFVNDNREQAFLSVISAALQIPATSIKTIDIIPVNATSFEWNFCGTLSKNMTEAAYRDTLIRFLGNSTASSFEISLNAYGISNVWAVLLSGPTFAQAASRGDEFELSYFIFGGILICAIGSQLIHAGCQRRRARVLELDKRSRDEHSMDSTDIARAFQPDPMSGDDAIRRFQWINRTRRSILSMSPRKKSRVVSVSNPDQSDPTPSPKRVRPSLHIQSSTDDLLNVPVRYDWDAVSTRTVVAPFVIPRTPSSADIQRIPSMSLESPSRRQLENETKPHNPLVNKFFNPSPTNKFETANSLQNLLDATQERSFRDGEESPTRVRTTLLSMHSKQKKKHT